MTRLFVGLRGGPTVARSMHHSALAGTRHGTGYVVSIRHANPAEPPLAAKLQASRPAGPWSPLKPKDSQNRS